MDNMKTSNKIDILLWLLGLGAVLLLAYLLTDETEQPAHP